MKHSFLTSNLLCHVVAQIFFAWLESTKDRVGKTVQKEKWIKAQTIVRKWKERLSTQGEAPELNHKELEKDVGFMCHLSMTFDNFRPFLKGWYLTLNSWRPNRDERGWKLKDKDWRRLVASEEWRQLVDADWDNDDAHSDKFEDWYRQANHKAPKVVRPVPRLFTDMEALHRLLVCKDPPVLNVRVRNISFVVYGFADASGSGFGSSYQYDDGIRYRVGVWGKDSQEESSNWREFTNCVDSITAEAKEGRLTNAVVFLFTDNSTTESAWYKGSSSSKTLLELVIRLKELETHYSMTINLIHVAGTRMIDQGTDGISRGSLTEGVMEGRNMLSFIPIHKSALIRHHGLQEWFSQWTGHNAHFCEPIDWFELAHGMQEGSVFFFFPTHLSLGSTSKLVKD